MTFPRSTLHRTLGVMLLAGALSCVDGPTAPRPVALVTATPEALSLRPLDTMTVVARVTTLDGVEIVGRPMEWRARDTTIATVTAEGLVAARAYTGPTIRNTAIVVTTLGASADTVPVEVLPWAVARVIAGPAELTLSPRDSAQLTLRLESVGGLELSGRTIAWIADDTNVVQVNAAGRALARLYTGPLTRQTWIIAFSEGQSDSIRVTVPPLEVASITVSPATTSLMPGQLDTLSAVVRTADGQALTEIPLTWSSTDTTIARVNEEGVVTAMFYAGFETRVASVIAQFGSVADTTAVEIRPLAIARLQFLIDTISLRPGTTYQPTATLSDAAGANLADRPITWSAIDPLVAQVSDSGVISTQPYGGPLTRTARITAASAGVADTFLVTVTAHTVFSVAVSPERLTMQPLDSAQFTPHFESLFGDTLFDRTITYTSQNTTVVGASPDGKVLAAAYTGDSVRTTFILATSGTAVDTIPVEVLPFAVQSVVVSPSTVTLPPRGTDTLSVATLSPAGLPLTGRGAVWVSGDTAAVHVSAAGIITARPYFGPLERTVEIVVFSSGLSDTATVTVQPLTAATLQLAPATLQLRPNDVSTLTAVLRSATADTLIDFSLTWRSTDTTVARVNEEGIVTALYYAGPEVRSTSVIVTIGALADTAVVSVAPLAVGSVTIVAPATVVSPGSTLQLDASVRDAASLILSDRPITWSSSDTTRARVSATGVVTALPYGGADARSVQIFATSESAADTVTLTLPPLDAAWLTATPEALSLQPLDTTTITARVESFDLTELTGRLVSFASLDTTVVRVNALGHVTAAAYTGPEVRFSALVLRSGAATDTVPVTITPFAVARVVATPSAVTIAVGDSTTLTAVTESTNGTQLSAREYVWISGDTAVVQVTPEGLVRARPYAGPLVRSTSVVVFSGGLADTTTVTVTPRSASSLEVTPQSVTLSPGGVTTLGTAVRTAGGELLSDFPLTWTSTDTLVARVNVEGVVTAQFYVGAATRSAMIIVSTGGLADTTSIDVLPLAVDSVAIAPNDGTLLPSATFLLDVAFRDADGLLLEGRIAMWTSLDPTVASVNGGGLVTASAFGGTTTRTARIVASSGGAADTVTLTVTPHTVAAVTATPEALSLLPRDTATITPTLTALDLTVLSNRTVTWASLDVAVANVDANGLVTAAAYTGPAVRSTSIVATSGTATDTIPTTVTPFAVDRVIATPSTVTLSPDETTTLTVSLESLDGTVLTGRDRLWLSSDTSIVTVDSLSGLITARPYAGALDRVIDIVVYSEGKADTVAVTVSALAAVSVIIAPDTVSIFPGEQTTLAATLRSASDTVLVGRPLTWTSADPAIATVNADGVVLGLFYVGPNDRSVEMVATHGALADTALVRVRALLVDSIAVFPDTQTIQAAQTAQLAVVLRDSAGLFLEGRTVVWTSSDPTRATVSSTGLVSALVAGTVTITATSGGLSSQATITIVPVVTNVRVTPELSTVWIGRTLPLTVALRDSNGVEPAGRVVTWTSSNPAVATVSDLGVVTALSTGEVSITATSEGRADTVSLDIFPEPTAAVTITFDDSWRGVLELAYPVMQQLRLRANVGWITSVNWSGVMNPTELRVLQDGGWSIVSHSMTHPYLTQIPLDSARFELDGSRARIDSLGFDPRVFIAPYLNHNDAVLLESAAAGYTYTRCCAEDTWSTDTLVSWPIQPAARHRLAGVDVTNYEGHISSYNFRTAEGRTRLRSLLLEVVAEGKFIDVFFHDVLPEDVPDLRLTMEILAEFRPYLITYGMLP